MRVREGAVWPGPTMIEMLQLLQYVIYLRLHETVAN
jgi:hypothetical protein